MFSGRTWMSRRPYRRLKQRSPIGFPAWLSLFAGAVIAAVTSGGALAGEFDIYCSSANPAPGDGSLANPYHALASINWTTVSNQIAAGNTVGINLQSGAVFREKWSIPFGLSGSPSARIVVKPFGSGPNPVIAGDDIITGFAQYLSGAGLTWTGSIVGAAAFTFVDGNKLSQGTNTDSLANGQWFANGNTLYLRWDDGDPDLLGRVVEASVRDTCVYAYTSSNIDFVNINMRRGTAYGMRLRLGANITATGCKIGQGNLLLDLDTFTNFVARSCQFKDGWFGNEGVLVEGNGGSFAFWFCSFEHFPNTIGPVVFIGGGPGGAFVNCSFEGTAGYHAYNSSSNANVWFANCVFSGVGAGQASGGYAVRSAAGTCNLTNCLVMSNGKTPPYRLAGANEYGTVWGEPQYNHVRYPAILSFCLDDTGNFYSFQALANLMKTNYGWRGSFAYDRTFNIAAAGTITNLNALLADGHEILCHSRWHSTLTEPRAFYLMYTGAARTATLTIANSNLSTVINGNVDLNLSLTNASCSTLGRLVALLSARTGYVCTPFPLYDLILPSGLLTNAASVDISSGPYTNYLDYTNWLANEVVLSKADLETAIGNGYTCKAFNYPSGNNDANVRQVVTNTGYLSARGVTTAPFDGYLLSSMNVFRMAIAPNTKGIAMILNCESNANDFTALGNNFTAYNVTYDNTRPYSQYCLTYDSVFDGSSAYMSRPFNSYYDFSQGDWLFTTQLWPTALTALHTLFFEGTDSNNYVRVCLDPAGRVVVDAKTNGTLVVSFASPAGSITNGGWQNVCVQEVYNTWSIRVNYVPVATTNSTARLAAFGANVYIGCGYNGSTLENYYSGYLDNIVAAADTYSKTISMLDQMCEEGCLYVYYGHGQTTAPLELWRAILDAVHDYSGNVMVMPQSDAVNYLRTNGVLLADGMTVMRTNPLVAANDYNMRSTSPMLMAGLGSVLVGQTNLADINGLQITDGNGQLLRNGVSLGAREYQPPLTLPSQSNQTLAGTGTLTVTNAPLGPGFATADLTYLLLAGPTNAVITTNGVILWTPAANQVPSTNLFTTVVLYSPPGGQTLAATNSFTVVITNAHNGPTLPAQFAQNVNELSTLLVTNTAIDTDVPSLALTYQLVNPPLGATIDTNGIVTWTPTEAQGPSTNILVTVVTDSGSPPLSATNSFTVVVNEVNLPPVLPFQSNILSSALAPVVVTNTATDPDIPANPLSYVLFGPTNALIDTNGIITWTPSLSQVPSTNLFTTVVTDYNPWAVNAQNLSATNTFTVTVNAIHNGPVLTPIPDRILHAGMLLTVSNFVVDSDVPPLPLTFTLGTGAPVGVALDPASGLLTWLSSDAVANTTNRFSVIVSDNGSPSLSDSKAFTVTVVARPSLQASILSNSIVCLTWPAISGQTYRVQYRPGFTGTNWISLVPDVTGTASGASALDPLTGDQQRYYRVMILP